MGTVGMDRWLDLVVLLVYYKLNDSIILKVIARMMEESSEMNPSHQTVTE